MLCALPRRETGKTPKPAIAIVKLRTTVHGGASRPIPQRYDQLTVPAEIAEQLPKDAKFKVTFQGKRIIYELIEPNGRKGSS
jgi:hypothetical protein